MKIVGEKINGTRAAVKQAVLDRDADSIRELATKQVEAGADYLDLNAGTPPDREAEDLVWLTRVAQEAVEIPLCLDSSNNSALEAALAETKQPPLINSISGEGFRINETLPLAAAKNCPVIALALDENGIPKDAEGRMKVIRSVFQHTSEAGLPDDHVYVDPLVIAVATDNSSGHVTWGVMRAVREEFPEAHFAMGLSNISFGMPARNLINSTFLALSMAEGLDMAIMDPMDRRLVETIYAAEALLGQDRFCLSFTKAFRAGKIGPIEEK